jgi:hypothetical protein
MVKEDLQEFTKTITDDTTTAVKKQLEIDPTQPNITQQLSQSISSFFGLESDTSNPSVTGPPLYVKRKLL